MRRLLRTISIISILLSYSAGAQPVTLSAVADKHKILIGEPLKLEVTATAPRSVAVQWPAIDSIYHFEILHRSEIDTQLSGSDVAFKRVYTLTSWDSGRWQLPSFHTTGSNKTKPLPIEVAYTPFDPKQDYHDIKDILDVKPPARITWYWYVIGAVLLLLLFWLLFPQRRRKETEEVPLSAEAVYKEAMKRLEQLKKQQTNAEAKGYYTALIDIFREYLYKRKNMQSFSKTTEDLAHQVKSLQMPAADYQALVPVLQLSDMVKFAKYQPQPDETKTAWETIRKSIVTIEHIK